MKKSLVLIATALVLTAGLTAAVTARYAATAPALPVLVAVLVAHQRRAPVVQRDQGSVRPARPARAGGQGQHLQPAAGPVWFEPTPVQNDTPTDLFGES